MTTEQVIEETMKGVHSLGHREYIAMKGTWGALLKLEKLGLPIRDTDGDFAESPGFDPETILLKAYNYKDMVALKPRAAIILLLGMAENFV